MVSAPLTPEQRRAILWELCEDFMKEQRITCSETIHQSDRVIENAYEFIDEICTLIGYPEHVEED